MSGKKAEMEADAVMIAEAKDCCGEEEARDVRASRQARLARAADAFRTARAARLAASQKLEVIQDIVEDLHLAFRRARTAEMEAESALEAEALSE